MDNLSIVIRDVNNKIYEHLESLKPLLEDNKCQLILINNKTKKFDIPYEYTHYEFNENYNKFIDFYESISLYDSKLLIERGIQLNIEFIKKIKECIECNKNLKIKIKKFISFDKTQYVMDDLKLILNDSSNEFESLNHVILEDYSMIYFELDDMEEVLYKLLKKKSYGEIYNWYNVCIKSKSSNYEQKFFEVLENLKCSLNIKEEKISKIFILNNVNERYSAYLSVMSLYQEKPVGFIEKIKILLSKNNFQEQDIYFSNFIKKLFKDNRYCFEFLNHINMNSLNAYNKYILDKNETFYIDMYNYTMLIDLGKEFSIKNNRKIPLILNILKSYITYMDDKSADREKKNILIQMFLDYVNCGLYILNYTADINDKLNLNDEVKFLIEMNKVVEYLNKNLINEAISVLKKSSGEYKRMTMVIRYYIQKLIRDNNLYPYKLSICMMAKDEEKFLNKCLGSIKPLLDSGTAELIFVDTGSTDTTVEIASNYTDKIYHKPWEGNFSKMRNYSISLAQGEYIFILDADEELEKGECEKLIALFNSEEYKKYNLYTFKEKNFSDEQYEDFSMLTRNAIFENREDFYYYGTVHNQPNKIGPINDLDIILLHYGYIMTEDIKNKKFERTANLLKNELQKNPDYLYYRMQLSTSYSMHEEPKKALEQVELYMKLLKGKELTRGLNLMACNNAVVIYHSNGLYEKVIELCNRALKIEPTFIDFVYNKALAQFALEEYSEAINNYLRYLELVDNAENLTVLNDDRYIFYSLGSKNEALGKLLICYYKINDCDSFNKTIDKIDDDTLLKYCVYTILKFYIENKRYGDLKQFFIEKIMLNDSYDVKYVFSYFISEIIDECDEEEKQNIIKLFNNTNESNEYLETIKSLISSVGDSLAILDFINRCNLDKLDLVTAKMVLDKTYELVVKDDFINNFTLEEIKALKNGALFILNNTINSKLFKGLTKEKLLVIINNYIKLCSELIKNKRYDLLSEKEIEFLKIIKLAKEDFNNNNLTLGLRKIKDAVLIHKEMARPLQLYLETVIPGYNANLEYFNNDNGEEKMNNELIEYSKKIKAEIERLINSNSLDKAMVLIEEYEKIIKNDIDIYSMKSIILIMEDKLDAAKDVLLSGLNTYSENFDLNYNLAYIYEQQGSFNNAVRCYNVALVNCNDDQIKKQISVSIDNIATQNNIDLDRFKTVVKSTTIKKVLFLQNIPCIRTNKVAKAINEKGIQTDIVYLSAHPSEVYKDLELPYKNIYKLNNINEMIEFINKSDYDIIYSSNEPDYLTVLFMATNKPIVHDTHDMMSLRGDISVEQQVLEYIANVKSDGNIYVIPQIKDIAIKRFDIKNKPILTLNSFIEKDLLPSRFLEKLSNKDGEIHCVFEGGLASVEGHHRYLEPIFLKLAENNIHVHLHCPVDPEYIKQLVEKSKYIHYEGVMSPKDLIIEMTKYDVGLAIFNLNKRNKTFLDTAFPNKIWDYLASGIPILFADLLSFKQFANYTSVGKVLDIDKDIKNQLEEVKNINIEEDILIKKKWVMNEVADDIINFLAEVKKSHMQKREESYQDSTNDDASIYNEIYKTGGYDQAYFKHYSQLLYINMWNKALEIIKEIKHPKMIDIGCGSGQFANLLFDNGITSYKGIDFSSEAIKLAKLRNEKYVDLFCIDDAYTSNIYYDDYNTSILFEVLEHIQDDLSVLNKIKRGTKVLFSVPNFDSKSHVRLFNTEEEIINRYSDIVQVEKIHAFNISEVNKLFLVISVKR